MPRLTDLTVERTKPGTSRREIPDALLPGLYLIVQASGAKSWAVRYRHAGKPAKHTLGPYPKLKLEDARKIGRDALTAVARGDDPAEQRREERRQRKAGLADRDQFGVVWADYIKRHVRPNLRESSARELEGLAKREILPKWRKRRLSEIGRRDVLDLLDDITDRGVPLTANKTFAALRTFFNWCIKRDILAVSPCSGLGKPTPETPRDRVLSDDELRWLWRACGAIGWPFGPITRLLILTGARREEVRAMPVHEFNTDGRVWTIAAARTKNGREHEVALSDPALEVIESVPRVSNPAGYLFCTNGKTAPSGFSRAKRRLDSLMLGYAEEEAKRRGDDPSDVAIAPWRLHDIRRTVASGMARLGVALPVIERCLNHVSGSFAGIVGVYQRHQFTDEKRTAFDDWARHVETIASRKPARVVPMRKAAR